MEIIYKEDSYAIIGACMEVHRELGMGFNEVIYKDALEIELKLKGIPFQREPSLPVFYKEQKIRTFKADFIVFDKIVLEVKAVSRLIEDHERQTIAYLSASGYRLGLLVNFGESSLQQKRLLK